MWIGLIALLNSLVDINMYCFDVQNYIWRITKNPTIIVWGEREKLCALKVIQHVRQHLYQILYICYHNRQFNLKWFALKLIIALRTTSIRDLCKKSCTLSIEPNMFHSIHLHDIPLMIMTFGNVFNLLWKWNGNIIKIILCFLTINQEMVF